MTQPTVRTERLILRPFATSDAADVQRLAGDRNIADTTLNIPHPYEDGMAEAWIDTHAPAYTADLIVTFAIVLQRSADLIGAVGLTISRPCDKAELGYWIGKPYWNHGYATEAAKAVVDFGFVELGLNRIAGRHLVRNPTSGRVLEKIGMLREGSERQSIMKWGKYEDLVLYGVLRND